MSPSPLFLTLSDKVKDHPRGGLFLPIFCTFYYATPHSPQTIKQLIDDTASISFHHDDHNSHVPERDQIHVQVMMNIVS